MHIAIIMDGNGRWAKKNNIPIINGHKKGAEKAQEIILHALHSNISILTLYTLSIENQKRSSVWLEQFFYLLKIFFQKNLTKLHEKNIKVRFIGNQKSLPFETQNILKEIEEQTQNNSKMIVNIALGYSGRDEIIRAVKKLSTDEIKTITEEKFYEKMDTASLPDPDLLIRTSGEQRLSNFLLWQLAYSEFFFSDKLWPDFSRQDFDDVLESFKKRERRFGK